MEVTLYNQHILLRQKSTILTFHHTEVIANHNYIYEDRVMSTNFQDIYQHIYFIFIMWCICYYCLQTLSSKWSFLKYLAFPNINIKSVKDLIFSNFLSVYLQNSVTIAGTATIKSKVFWNSFGKILGKLVLFAAFLKNELFYRFSYGSLTRF